MKSIEQLVEEIAKLPPDWHLAGSVKKAVLKAIVKHIGERVVSYSMETGSGRTTLLFSHLSLSHKVFARECGDKSVAVVRDSPLLKQNAVEFIEGPTQLTLPRYVFEHKLQVALLDGPHGYPFPELEYYHVYPHLAEGALLVIDDIHIPTIHHLFTFLREDEMFRYLETVDHTAFFARTNTPVYDPYGDGWERQNYNKRRFPVESLPDKIVRKLRQKMPKSLKNRIKQILDM